MAAFLALLQKDILLELRRKDTLIAVFFFGLLIVVLFSFAFAPGQMTLRQRQALGPGIMWIAFSFSAVTAMHVTFDKERLNDSFDGMLMAPVAPALMYASKLTSSAVILVLIQTVLLPLFVALLNLTVTAQSLLVLPAVALGTLGFLATGTLFSAVTMRLQTRALLLPLLNFPLTIPILIPAVEATATAIGTWKAEFYWNMILFLVGANLIYITAGVLLFPRVLRA